MRWDRVEGARLPVGVLKRLFDIPFSSSRMTGEFSYVSVIPAWSRPTAVSENPVAVSLPVMDRRHSL